MGVLSNIPIVRVLMSFLEKRSFTKSWRKINKHNETKVGDRIFPIDIIKVAGIKIWMVTGDKMETAKNIAFASGLFTQNVKP